MRRAHPTTIATIRSCLPWAFLTLAVVAATLVLSNRPAAAQAAPVAPVAEAPAEASPVADPEVALGAEGALVGVRQVATGEYHSCALLNNGQVRCWGEGGYGQLGQGSPTESDTAVTVLNSAGTAPLVNATQVIAGYEFSCALLVSREVKCWGYNGDGELGDGTTDPSLLPAPVHAVSGAGNLQSVTQISTGGESVCARVVGGQVRCWGYNDAGQLGDDSVMERHLPVVVQNVAGTGPLLGVTQVDAGWSNTCVTLNNGQARCWGKNNVGQVGDGTTQPRHRPVVVKNPTASGPLTGVAEVSVGYTHHVCARLVNGQARCWGSNVHRQLGHGTSANAVLPLVVTNGTGTGHLSGIREIDAGYHATCAALESGQVRCWGQNQSGQLGNGTLGGADRRKPKPVKNATGTGVLVGVRQLDFTDAHVCVRLQSGQARCWGENYEDQLGNGGGPDSPLPVRVQI